MASPYHEPGTRTRGETRAMAPERCRGERSGGTSMGSDRGGRALRLDREARHDPRAVPLFRTHGYWEVHVARALLRAGGISALQTASIAAALPFLLVMLIMTLALIRSRTDDPPGETR